MKTLLTVLLLAVGLTACGPEPKYKVPTKERMEYKLLETYEPENGPTIRVVCIDGIKYIRIGDTGITPKFQAWQDADATVEECE
jgi:hypothetical protein